MIPHNFSNLLYGLDQNGRWCEIMGDFAIVEIPCEEESAEDQRCQAGGFQHHFITTTPPGMPAASSIKQLG